MFGSPVGDGLCPPVPSQDLLANQMEEARNPSHLLHLGTSAPPVQVEFPPKRPRKFGSDPTNDLSTGSLEDWRNICGTGPNYFGSQGYRNLEGWSPGGLMSCDKWDQKDTGFCPSSFFRKRIMLENCGGWQNGSRNLCPKSDKKIFPQNSLRWCFISRRISISDSFPETIALKIQ